MQITAVVPQYLYAVKDVFPAELLEQIQLVDWAFQPYTRQSIGWGRRRRIDHDHNRDIQINQYCYNQLKTAVEQQCGVQFVDDVAQASFQYWLDEPGFRPARHTDGNLPSAVQIYLQAGGRRDLGTEFYQSTNPQQILHTFASQPNTGYIMLNQPELGRPLLWHDMTQEVPPDVLRLCLYVTFGKYLRV